MILVAGVNEPTFRRIQLDTLAFLANKLVLDLLKVAPISENRLPI
jgi:hypothetical protein